MRVGSAIALLSWLGLAPWAGASTTLPKGFAGIEIGALWDQVADLHDFQNLATTTTEWGAYVAECGYRSVLTSFDQGQLMITVNDSIVTDVSYITSVEPASDLFALADLVIQSYGQPDSAIMRDLFGQVTIDEDRVNFITLQYRRRNDVTFYISGRELWQYQIRVQLERYRWHENKTLRCAREKDAAAKEEQPFRESTIENPE